MRNIEVMKSGSGKGYTKNLLLAATIISLSTTMPMNVAYAFCFMLDQWFTSGIKGG